MKLKNQAHKEKDKPSVIIAYTIPGSESKNLRTMNVIIVGTAK